jgi:hypothetical protein
MTMPEAHPNPVEIEKQQKTLTCKEHIVVVAENKTIRRSLNPKSLELLKTYVGTDVKITVCREDRTHTESKPKEGYPRLKTIIEGELNDVINFGIKISAKEVGAKDSAGNTNPTVSGSMQLLISDQKFNLNNQLIESEVIEAIEAKDSILIPISE